MFAWNIIMLSMLAEVHEMLFKSEGELGLRHGTPIHIYSAGYTGLVSQPFFPFLFFHIF